MLRRETCDGEEEETGWGSGEGGLGFVRFLWTVVSHGLEVSLKDKMLGI